MYVYKYSRLLHRSQEKEEIYSIYKYYKHCIINQEFVLSLKKENMYDFQHHCCLKAVVD